jgi:uncharacterized protein VirK/YbjX
MSAQQTKTLDDVVREVLREYAIQRGWQGLPKLFAKLCLLAWHYRAHRRWLGTIGGVATRRILAVEPRTAYRHSSKYLFAGLPWKTRIALMSGHYAFLNRTHDATFFDKVIAPQGLQLWQHETDDGRVTIVLLGPPHHREGDLRLHLKLNGTTVFKLAFSVVPACFFEDAIDDATRRSPLGAHVLYIGQVQGVPGQLDAIRVATKSCNDIAPPDLLMAALAGIAHAWGIARFFSAGADIHHSAEKLSRSLHAFDYAAFWTHFQAVLLPSGHYAIEVPFPQKPIAQIVTRHRKRALVKRAVKLALCAEVSADIERWMHRTRQQDPSADPSMRPASTMPVG